MIDPVRWFDRMFPFDADPKTFPCVVERLRGTAARIADRLAGLARETLTERDEGRWSIQENVGHLADLERLWLGRIEDIRAGRAELRPADLENTATHQADHNSATVDDLLVAFRSTRAALVELLDDFDEQGVLASAFHPRLRRPIRVIDLATFVADHDDHHLARMHQLALKGRRRSQGRAMTFMVIEHFRPGKAQDVYRRLRNRGRMAPADVRHVASWVDLEFRRCFQVMEADSEAALKSWTNNWDDLVDFEIVPVRTSEQAAATIAREP